MALTPVAAVTRHIPPPPSSSSISSPPRVFAPIPKRRKSMHRHHGHGGDDNANAAARATTPTTTTTTRSTFAFQGLHQHQQPAAEEDDDDDVDVEDEDGIDAELSRALQELVSLHNSNNHDGDNHDGPAASIPHGITTAGKASKMNGSIGVGAGAGVVIDKSQLLTAEELERTAEQLLEHCDAVNKTHNNTSNKPLASITNLPRFVASRSSPSPALVAADEDRLSDDYAARGGGKKRKVPSSAQQGPTIAVHGEFSIYRDERQSSSSSCVHSCGHTCGGGGSGAEAAAALADESASYDSGSEVCCEFHYKHSSVDETTGSGSGDPGSFSASRAAATRRIPPRKHTPARKACGFEKKLFQARKSQVLGLHADAIACMDKEHGQGKGSPNNTKTSTAPGSQQAAPTLDELEELVRALEYASVTGWEGDRVGSGAGMWEGQGKGWSTIKDPAAFAAAEAPEPQEDRLRWRKRGRALERSRLLTRDPIQRGGWIPEGSFEFEAASPLAKAISGRHQQLSLLRSKVTQLLTLTLGTPSMSKLLNSNNKPNKTTPTTATPKAAIKPAVQRTTKTTPAPTSVPASADKKQPTTKKVEPLPPTKNTPDIVIEPSADDPNYVPPPPPKGKKKKKRSANASNPHHVKNYVPTRKPTPQTAKEPTTLPDLINMLFFPPPTRFLNARPGGKQPKENEIAANSDEYVCCFCEYDLFYGSEALMEKTIRRRKKVLERRSKASAKARNVVDGKGLNPKTKTAAGSAAGTETAEVDEDGVPCAGGDDCRCDEIRAARKSKGGGTADDNHHHHQHQHDQHYHDHPGEPLPKEDAFSLDDPDPKRVK